MFRAVLREYQKIFLKGETMNNKPKIDKKELLISSLEQSLRWAQIENEKRIRKFKAHCSLEESTLEQAISIAKNL